MSFRTWLDFIGQVIPIQKLLIVLIADISLGIRVKAVLSIKKSCVVAHAFQDILLQLLNSLMKKWKGKLSDAACAVFYKTHRKIYISETQVICIPGKG